MASNSRPSRSELVSLVLAALFTALPPWLAGQSRSNWVWGLNSGSFLGPHVPGICFWVSVGVIVLGMLSAWSWRGAAASAAPGGPLPAGPARSPWFLAALASILSAPLFWLLRERIHFLGDTTLRLRSMYGAANGGLPVLARAMHAAPLDFALLLQLPIWLTRHLPIDIFHSAQVVPCAIGGVFVGAAALFASRASSTTLGRIAVFGLLVSQGYLEVFCGYCKGFGLLLALILLWCWAVHREDGERSWPAQSLIFLGLALLAHRTAAFLLPAEALLLWRGRKAFRAWPGPLGSLAVFAACAAWALQVAGDTVGNDATILQAILHPGASWGGVAMFSRMHLANLLNEIYLLIPSGYFVAKLLWRPRSPFMPWTAIALGSVGFFLALLIAPAQLQGAPRDWDLFTPAGLFGAVLAAQFLAARLDRSPRLAPLAFAVALCGAIQAGAWLGLNATEAPAIERVHALANGLPALPVPARAEIYEYLGEYHELNDRPGLAAEGYLSAAELLPNPRFYILAGTELWDAGRHREAVGAFREAALRDPVTREKLLLLAAGRLARDPADSVAMAMREGALAAPPSK